MCCLLGLGRLTVAQIKSEKTFKVDVNLVLVNATVTGPDGATARQLGPEDFVITEDMKEQELRVFHPTTSPFHVVLLIDTSASTAGKLDLIQRAAARFFDQLAPADQISILEVGESPNLIEGFTRDRGRLTAAVKRLGKKASRSTRLYDSIIYALDNLLGNLKDRKALVILSDACDNGSSANQHQMKLSLYRNDAVIYGLLVDTAADQIEVLRTNLRRASCVSLVLCADNPNSENGVKQAARLLVDFLPPSSRVSLYQNDYRRSLVNILQCELSRDRIGRGIEESKPYCNSPVRAIQRSRLPDGEHLTIAIINSIAAARDLIPGIVLKKAAPLLVGDLSELEIRHQISAIVGDLPANPEEVFASLPESYREARSILSEASRTTGGRAFDLAKLEQVDQYYSQVAQELRTIYTLGYYSSNSSPLLRSVRVKVRRPGYTVKAREAYLPRAR